MRTGSQSRRGLASSERAALLVALLSVTLVALAASMVAPSRSSARVLTHGADLGVAEFQSSDGPRHYEGAVQLVESDLGEIEPYITRNRVTLTLPPEGEDGAVEGEFEISLEIPGPVLYVQIAELAAEVGAAIGESVNPLSGLTADQVEESGIEVPPGFDDCVVRSSISGSLPSASATTLGGETSITTAITGPGCEDTEATLPPGGQTTVASGSWTAILTGDRISGSVELVEEDGDTSQFFFAATLGASSGSLACPSVEGFEEGIGSGDVLDAGNGDYQRALICRYLSDDGGSFQLSARWDWADPPAGAEPTSCGLPQITDTLGSGNLYGYTYSQSAAALVSWTETSPTGLSHGEFASLAAPLLPPAEALAIACLSSDGGGGAVVAPAGSVASDDGDGGGDAGGNPFTDFVLGDGGSLEVEPEEAAAAAAVGAGMVALTSLVLVLANGTGTGAAGVTAEEAITDALLDGLETGPPIGATVLGEIDEDGDAIPDAMAIDTDEDGQVDTAWTPETGRIDPDTPLSEALAGATGTPAVARAPEPPTAEPPTEEPPPTAEEMLPGSADELLEGLEDLPLGGQRPPETIPGGFGSSAEMFDTDADGEFDTVHIDAEQDGVIDAVIPMPVEGAVPPEAASDAGQDGRAGADDTTAESDLADDVMDLLDDAPPVGATVVGQEDFNQDNRPDITGFDVDEDGILDTAWTPEGGRADLDDDLVEVAREAQSAGTAADLEAESALPAGTPTDELEADGSSPEPATSQPEPVQPEPVAEEPATEPAEPTADAVPTAPGEMNAGELANLVRTHPRAQVLQQQDLDALARLIEDPTAREVEIIPPVGGPVIKDVGVGFLKTDINLTRVTNTDTGVRFRLTGGIEVPVGVEDGRLVLDVPERYSRFTGAADGYLEQLNRAFEESGRQIESISMTDESFLKISTEPRSAAPDPDTGSWQSGHDDTDLDVGIGTTG